MIEQSNIVRSLLIQLQQDYLLLPNVAVSEVIGFSRPQSIPGAPPWLLGWILWRNQRVPLIVLEGTLGKSFDMPDTKAKVAVCKTISKSIDFPYISILSKNIPSLVNVTREMITPASEQTSNPLISCHANINNINAIIPDLEACEQRVMEAMGG